MNQNRKKLEKVSKAADKKNQYKDELTECNHYDEVHGKALRLMEEFKKEFNNSDNDDSEDTEQKVTVY